MIHDTVVDTSVVFPHSRGPPYKKALRTLCGDILQKIIQNDGITRLKFPILTELKHFFLNSRRSRQCRRRYCVHGTNDVENQTRFKATQVKILSRQKIITGQRRRKTNAAIFFSLPLLIFIVFIIGHSIDAGLSHNFKNSLPSFAAHFPHLQHLVFLFFNLCFPKIRAVSVLSVHCFQFFDLPVECGRSSFVSM